MHELPVTDKILDIALKHAQQSKATRIYSITLRVGGLTDLEDTWLQHYNYERPHRGYRNMGRRPIETVEFGKKKRKELMKEAA